MLRYEFYDHLRAKIALCKWDLVQISGGDGLVRYVVMNDVLHHSRLCSSHQTSVLGKSLFESQSNYTRPYDTYRQVKHGNNLILLSMHLISIWYL